MPNFQKENIKIIIDALKRFENLDARRVAEITFEVARLGENGLDYSSSEKKYRLTSCPEESFSGLPHVCRFQTHRSRSGYRHGFERALDYCAWVV
jgi:hypothetical protein